MTKTKKTKKTNKTFPYIINIIGIQGSGKSYICNKLNHIPCIDTDKIVYNTFTNLLINNKKFQKYLTVPDNNEPENIPEKASNLLFKQATKNLQNKIKSIKHPLVIVVGITIDIKSDLKFFIKIKENELKNLYRRLMMREVNKVKINYNNIEKIILNENVNYIATTLLFKYEIGAINLIYPFAGFKKQYQDLEKYELKNNTLVKTQTDIINQIQKIYNKLNN